MNRTREQWKQADANSLSDYGGNAFHAITNAKADIEELHDEADELRRKPSCAEAELIRQTGCTAEDVARIYDPQTPKPVVNVRMGQSHRLRFEAEDERDALRAKLAALVEASKHMLYIFDRELEPGTFGRRSCDEMKAAIAAAESEAANG